jgi:AGZA family xanthine/uracil permease-like MFS transporter
MTIPQLPSTWVTVPDFGLVGQFDLFGAFGHRRAVRHDARLHPVFSNFFDAMGTMTGLAKNAGLAYKDGTFPRLRSRSSSRASAPSPAA